VVKYFTTQCFILKYSKQSVKLLLGKHELTYAKHDVTKVCSIEQ